MSMHPGITWFWSQSSETTSQKQKILNDGCLSDGNVEASRISDVHLHNSANHEIPKLYSEIDLRNAIVHPVFETMATQWRRHRVQQMLA